MKIRHDGLRWFLSGLAAWTLVALLWTLANGLQRAARGEPLLASVRDLSDPFLLVFALAVLSPFALLAIRRAARWPVAMALPLWLAIGAAYWIAAAALQTALVHAGVVRAEGATCGVTFAQLLFRCGFRTHLVFAAMVMLHETVRHMRQAQRWEVGTARMRAELARVQTSALRAELQPHFLFNTLHVASGLMNTDVRAATGVLANLSALLRQSLARNGAPRVGLREEVALIERYLEIQQARFGDRLDVRFRIERETLDLPVPSLILQPLVENAIQHGISHRRGGGRIEIVARREPGCLCLRVADDGVGLPPGEHAPGREGIGIGSTRTRLRLLYGDGATIGFARPADGGFVVEIRIPEPIPAAHA